MSTLSYTSMHITNASTIFGSGGMNPASVDNPGSNDWQISRTGAGAYAVSFGQPLRTPPVVMVSPMNNKATANLVGEPTANGFSVACFNGAGTATDMNFMFLAMASN